MHKFTATLLVASLLLGISSTATHAAVSYTVTDLTNGMNISLRPTAINTKGDIVGYSDTIKNIKYHAFLYSNGVIKDLGTLYGSSDSISSFATGINDNGQIVGRSDTTTDNYSSHAFVYSNGVMKDLGTLIGSSVGFYSSANGINNNGQIVGFSNTPQGATHAFVYSNGVMKDLGTLTGSSGYDHSVALGINASGQIVGESNIAGIGDHAFVYSNGVMTDLGTLPNIPANFYSYSSASGINASGQIVGRSVSNTPNASDHAFVYSNGLMKDLGTLAGSTGSYFSAAHGINDNGQIVGHSATVNSLHAFVYTNGVMQDLNSLIDPSLGVELQYAYAINASGQIVADHYLLTPNVIIATAPTAPHLIAANLLSGSRISLTWTPVTGATGYHVYRGAVSGGPYSFLGAVSNATMFTDTNIQSSSQYYYVVTAVNSHGTSTNSNEVSVAVNVPGPIANLTAVGNDQTSVKLTWTPAVDATGYSIYRSTTSGGPRTLVGSTAIANTTSYIDGGLSRNTTYYYVVVPNNFLGNGPASPEVAGTPTITIAISSVSFSPSSIAAGSTVTGTVTLNSSALDTAYLFLTSSNSSVLSVPATAQIAAGSTSATFTAHSTAVTTLTNVTVTAYYNGVSKTTVVTVNPPYTSIPGPISNLTALGYDQNSVKLTWTAAANASYYRIYRSNVSYTLHTIVGSTTGTSFIDTGLTPGTSYYYEVVPVNYLGYGPVSPQVSAKTSPVLTISSVYFLSSTMSGGADVTGVLVLSGIAPPGNATVTLTSSNGVLHVPPTAQITAGFGYRSFTAHSYPVTKSTPVTVTATYGGISKTTIVTVNP